MDIAPPLSRQRKKNRGRTRPSSWSGRAGRALSPPLLAPDRAWGRRRWRWEGRHEGGGCDCLCVASKSAACGPEIISSKLGVALQEITSWCPSSFVRSCSAWGWGVPAKPTRSWPGSTERPAWPCSGGRGGLSYTFCVCSGSPHTSEPRGLSAGPSPSAITSPGRGRQGSQNQPGWDSS